MNAVALLDFPFGGDDFLSAFHKDIRQVYGFVEQSSSIVAEVDDHSLNSLLFLELQKSLFHLFTGVLSKSGKFDVSDITAHDSVIRDVIDFDIFTCDILLDEEISPLSFNLDLYFRSRLSFQDGAHLVIALPHSRLSVYLHDLVTGQQSGFLSRRPLIGFRDDYVIILLVDQSSDTSILTGCDKLIIFNFCLRNKVGIWIQG